MFFNLSNNTYSHNSDYKQKLLVYNLTILSLKLAALPKIKYKTLFKTLFNLNSISRIFCAFSFFDSPLFSWIFNHVVFLLCMLLTVYNLLNFTQFRKPSSSRTYWTHVCISCCLLHLLSVFKIYIFMYT